MSWIEKINTDFRITTGDGAVFVVYWMNAEKTKEYNVSEFTFPEIAGSFVDRRQPKGRKYNLEFFFQGENHLKQTELFELSADDPRPWVISHPFYGEITVQPVSLNFDNRSYNVTKISGTVIETITNENPITSAAPFDTIILNTDLTNQQLTSAYATTPQRAQDVSRQQQWASSTYSAGRRAVPESTIGQDYYNSFRKAQSKINVAGSDAGGAITAVRTFIETPAQFAISVTSRVSLFSNQFGGLRNSLSNITEVSSKNSYLSWLGMLISGACLSTAYPGDNDYKTRPEVSGIADTIMDMFSAYVSDLDSLQTPNGGKTNSFIPDAYALRDLSQLVNLSISNLFTIALGARQERSLYLEDDTNIVVLTHRLYGLDPGDNNMNELIESNNVGINEIDILKKGRKILYYV